MAFDPERYVGVALHGRRAHAGGSAGDAGNGFEGRIELPESVANLLRRRGDHLRGKSNTEINYLVRIVAGIDVPESDEAANHESGADEKNQRERGFGDDENSLEAMARAARAAAAFFERFAEIALRSFQRGRETEENSGEQGNDESEN